MSSSAQCQSVSGLLSVVAGSEPESAGSGLLGAGDRGQSEASSGGHSADVGSQPQ